MASAVRNATRMLGLPLESAVRMATRHPARFLRLEQDLGRIAPGMRANLVLADDDMNVEATWIDGRLEEGR
jgi:N-acetylglucosamine-6-phosphate deacetylase